MLWRVKHVSGRNTRTPSHTHTTLHTQPRCLPAASVSRGFSSQRVTEVCGFLGTKLLKSFAVCRVGARRGVSLGEAHGLQGGPAGTKGARGRGPGADSGGREVWGGDGQGDDLSVSEARKASGCGSGAFSARPDRMLSLRLGFHFWILSAASWESTSNSSSFDSLRAAQLPTRRGKISILEGAGCWGLRGGALLGACTTLAGNTA